MRGCPLYEKEDCECVNDDTALLKYAFALIKQQDEQIFQLENRLKECENGYAGTLHLESCKLHDAEERVKELTKENERHTEKIVQLISQVDCDKAEIKLLQKHIESLAETIESQEQELYSIKANTVREMQERLKEAPIKVGLPLFGLTTKIEVEYYANGLMLQMRDAIDRIADEILNNTEEEKK